MSSVRPDQSRRCIRLMTSPTDLPIRLQCYIVGLGASNDFSKSYAIPLPPDAAAAARVSWPCVADQVCLQFSATSRGPKIINLLCLRDNGKTLRLLTKQDAV